MKLTIGNKDIEIGPLTIRQYETIQDRPDLNDIEIVSLFSGLPATEIKKADYQQIIFVSKFLTSWISSQLDTNPLQLSMKFNGELLGLTSPSRMSYGEYTDLHVLLSEKEVDMRRVAAILYRPLFKGTAEDRVIQPYDYDECVERSKSFDNFPIKDYMSGIFFLTIYKDKLLEDFHSSLEKKKKELKNDPTREQKKNN